MSKGFYKSLLVPGIYSLLILGAAVIPVIGMKTEVKNFDKVLHAVEFGILGILLGMFLHRRVMIYGLCWIVGLACASELVQMVMPKRHFSFGDIAADLIGGVVCLTAVFFFRKRKDKSATDLTRKSPQGGLEGHQGTDSTDEVLR